MRVQDARLQCEHVDNLKKNVMESRAPNLCTNHELETSGQTIHHVVKRVKTI